LRSVHNCSESIRPSYNLLMARRKPYSGLVSRRVVTDDSHSSGNSHYSSLVGSCCSRLMIGAGELRAGNRPITGSVRPSRFAMARHEANSLERAGCESAWTDPPCPKRKSTIKSVHVVTTGTDGKVLRKSPGGQLGRGCLSRWFTFHCTTVSRLRQRQLPHRNFDLLDM